MKKSQFTFGKKSVRKFVAISLIVPQLLLGCKTADQGNTAVKTLYGNRSSWVLWSKGVFIDLLPSVHKAPDGTQTKYMCAYYGEGDPDFKPTNVPLQDLKTVWTAYSSSPNRWQSAPLDPDAVTKAIDETTDFRRSKLARHVGRFIGLTPAIFTGTVIAWIGVISASTAGIAFLYGSALFAQPVLLTVGGIGVAVLGLKEGADYMQSRGRIDQVDDTRGPLYDPATVSEADPNLDFKKLLNVLKKVPPMPPKYGIHCKGPGQILRELESSRGIREILNWRTPSITSGIKLSCSNLGGRSFILDRPGTDTNVRLSDDVGTTINKFSWDELNRYLRRDGSVIFNIEKFQKVSNADSSSAKTGSSGDVAGLKKYIEDNAPIQAQYDLLKNVVQTDRMVVVLTDLPSSGDMVDESCRFIETKLPK